MFMKLLVLIVLTAGIGATLLGLRQQQLELAHNMTALHRQIDRTRHALWDLQTQIAANLEPQKLRDAIDQVSLELELVVVATTPADAGDGIHFLPKSYAQDSDEP